MPFASTDQRHPHLRVVAEQFNPDRRKRPGFTTPPPPRGSRSGFAHKLTTQLDGLQRETEARPAPPAGIQPHLVFRVPLAKKAPVATVQDVLQKAGITVVGVEAGNVIIAFHDDVTLAELRKGIAVYGRGPRTNYTTGEPYKSTAWDALAFIEAHDLKCWGPSDRIGERLAEHVGAVGEAIDDRQLYVLDLELWHRGTREKARESLQDIRVLIGTSPAQDERIRDSFVGDSLCLVRVSCRGNKLRQLLALDIVAEVELPPVPVFDPRAARDATRADFPPLPRPPVDGPRVCVVDSGVTSSHPLLSNNVGHAEAILTPETSPDDAHGHGTMVSGIAVFGDVRACYSRGAFESTVTLYSARVLNAANRFDDEKLIVHQMRDAIRFFFRPPYDCRVFNISLGDDKAWLAAHRRQSPWAETLDLLARELRVLLVVSAGNQPFGLAHTSADAEETLRDYPGYLFRPECGLCEPATAAIPITVGGLATHVTPSLRQGVSADSVTRPVASNLEPTPTTRIGPGLNDAVKPEFVAPAGNTVFRDHQARVDDQGTAIMSLSHEPTERLFAFGSGTSYAAPFVARQAAIVWHRLAEYLGEDPHPNLVRAVLASSASVPDAAEQRIVPLKGEEGVRQAYGYGTIDEDFSLHSSDCRVVLMEQARIRIDSFLVYEIPVPTEFQQSNGRKDVSVSLAFDPPVRGRRAEYLGVQMWTALIRGKTLHEVVEAYRAETADERAAVQRNERDRQGAFGAPYKCDLKPGPRTLETSTLQKRTWQFRNSKCHYGEHWYLVVRAERTWAPASITEQDFAIAVTLTANEPQLYALIRQRLQTKLRARARG